jgi:hypothetical protein
MGSFDVLLNDARTQFEAFVEEYRSALESSLDGLTDEQARSRLVPSATTLLGRLKHVTWMQRVWFEECIGARSRLELGLVHRPEEGTVVLVDRGSVAVRTDWGLCLQTGREFGERAADAVKGGHIGGEFIVAASQVLHESVSRRNDAQRGDRLQPSHRAQPGLEPTVISLDPVIAVLLGDVPRGRGELVDDAQVHRCPVGGDLNRQRATGQVPG